jgi:hypothetical protein
MDKSEMNRREFQRLTGAALGGLIAGAGLIGSTAEAAGNDPANILSDPHVCRGINACKGKGADGKNTCAGTGSCATAAAHTCHKANACKGQGGCGGHPGENACKGQGACAVPLNKSSWAKARKTFEAAMKKAGKTFGDAPKG